MPTPSQIRAARGLLNWSQKDLAERAGVTEATIRNSEKDGASPNAKTLEKITQALSYENIDFIGDRGVEERRSDVQRYVGKDGFTAFAWDVFETAKRYGGEIVVNNVNERLFEKWKIEDNQAYQEAMAQLSNLKCKFLVEEGDLYFIASDYAEYRWTPKDQFGNIPFYIYGNKTALISFDDDTVTVYVIENQSISDFCRKQFYLSWQNAIIPHGDRNG